jgi:tetratricopeptide (TPR) repeat protein
MSESRVLGRGIAEKRVNPRLIASKPWRGSSRRGTDGMRMGDRTPRRSSCPRLMRVSVTEVELRWGSLPRRLEMEKERRLRSISARAAIVASTAVSELIETIEQCNWKLATLEDELPRLKEAARQDPQNGEKFAHLDFALLAADERDAALSAFTQALEWPATLCIHCHRDCLVNIGWDLYLLGEYEQALGWFEHACHLRQPLPNTERQNHLGIQPEADSDAPYQLALENVLLTLAKWGG